MVIFHTYCWEQRLNTLADYSSKSATPAETISYLYWTNDRTESVTDNCGTTTMAYKTGSELLSSITDPESIEFLDKETFSDAVSGDVLEADIVAKCKYLGGDKRILIHQENQGRSMSDFPKRMFKYFSRFYEEHDLDIYPIAAAIMSKMNIEERDRPFKTQ